MNHAITVEIVPVAAKLDPEYQLLLYASMGPKYSQEAGPNTPVRRPVDHQRSAKVEHNGHQIRKGQRPSSRLRAQPLLGYFCCVRIADGGRASRRKCSQTGKKDL